MRATSERWTAAQRDAISARGEDLLVAAAAGSGKTAVLVERVVELVTDPAGGLDVDRLLVVTFTEAAADEVRARVARALTGRLAVAPDDAHLQRQAVLVHRAPIGTLHAFCLQLVRRYFHLLGLDPSVQVLGEEEAALLRDEVLERVFEARYAAGDEAFLDLVERYGGPRDDAAVRRSVLALHDQAQALPWPEEWLQAAVSAYETGTDDADAQPWARELRAEAAAALDRALGRLARARDLAHSGGLEAHAACLAEDLERLAALRRAAEGPWEAFRRQAAAWAWERLPSARVASAGQRAVRDAVRQWRDRAKKEVEDLVQRVAARPMAEWLSELRQLAGPARTLVDLAVEFGQAYTSAKRAQARLDFADLERLAFRLLQDEGAPAGRLVPSPVACELRERFAAVLVDEYQDINPLQDAILRLLARPGAFFAVGDVKQSIYGFRLADPGLFAARSAAARRLPLRENFRSRPPLVTFVNETFARLMVPELAGTAYDEEARMVPAAEYPPPPPGVPVAGDGGIGPPACSLLLVDADGDGEGQGAGDALELEAAAVARQVRELVLGTPERPGPQQWVWDRQEGRYRPLTWRDVAVLLRTVRGRAEVFVEAFAREGVPACAEVSSGYFEAEEVRTVLSLLAVIDNPRQDIPLVGVLRSPVVDLTAEDLARVRLCLREGDFYDAVRAAARGAGPVPAELAERLDRFLSDLERWRTEARRGPLSRLLWRIYRETGYLYYVEGLPGGAARRANLLALLDRARQFDGFARQGLFRFLRFVERLREGGEPVGRPPAVGEGEDVVRVMSVHRSKGLEFPVVVVAGLGARFNLRDVGEDVLVDRELGLGLRVVDLEGRVKYPSAVHAAVARRRRRLLLGEELRLLYVAMTRARERLLLVGCVSERQRSAGAWALAAAAAGRSGPLSLADLLEAQCWLDWLVPVLLVRPDGADLRAAVGAWSEEARDTLGTGPQRLAVGGTGDTTTADAVAADAVAAGAAIFAAEVAVPAVTGGCAGSSAAAAATAPAVPVTSAADAASDASPGAVPDVATDADGEADRLTAALAARVDWRYPHAAASGLFAKVAATEVERLGRAFGGEDEAWPLLTPVRRPPLALRLPAGDAVGGVRNAAAGRDLTAAQRGAAVHRALQHLDLGSPLDEGDVRRQLEELVRREVLAPEEAAAVDAAQLARFFRSPLGRLVRKRRDAVRREVAFTCRLPARAVYGGTAVDDGEWVLVQGMIDCVVPVPGGVLVLDFKTDAVRRDDAETAATRYAVQMSIYAHAATRLYGCERAGAFVHFLAPCVTVPVRVRPLFA